MDFQSLLNYPPFALTKEEKQKVLLEELQKVTDHHRAHCKEYARFLDAIGYPTDPVKSIEDLAYLPIGIFKELELKSIPDHEVFKVLTSSGTTGQKVSKVYLDHETASWQQKALCAIMEDYLGNQRVPFLIIDSKQVLHNRDLFSARGAAILGFSIFASSVTYALDDQMQIDWEAVKEFQDKNQGKKTVIFGFTYLLWENLVQQLIKKNQPLQLQDSIVLHGGGWKKLSDKAVEKQQYKDTLMQWLGVSNVYNYYGMAEQTGSIYMECECGHLHASTYSDVIVRDLHTLDVVAEKEPGLIQVLSPFPISYPGHSLLTEDIGIVLGEDNCPCQRKGKYFQITGRVKKAELRGCSDTHG